MKPNFSVAFIILMTVIIGLPCPAVLGQLQLPGLTPKTPEISIEGAGGILKDNILAHLSLSDEACDSPQSQVQDAYSLAEKEIKQALRALGFYHPKIQSHFQRTADCWLAGFTIDPGPRVKIVQVDLSITGQAKDDPEFQAVLKKSPIQKGDPMDHGRYESLKSQIQNLALSRGYFDARFTRHELRVDPARNQAEVILHFDSGPRYQFGAIKIEQDILNPEFVRRYIALQPGEPFAGDKLTKVYQDLSDSGYFQNVEVQPQQEQAEDLQVPVRVRLFPRKRHYFKIGAGFDTNTGPRVSMGYENRYVNRRGHRTQLNLRFSPVRSEFSGFYRIPWNDPLRETLNFRGGYLREKTDTLTSNSATVGIQFIHPRRRWTETLGFDFQYEQSRVAGQSQHSLMAVPNIAWTRVKADDRLRPKRGWRLDFSVKGGTTLIGEPVRFLQARTYGKWIRQLPWRGRIISRAEIAATWADQFRNLPASHRFFAGGDTGIRGYGYKRLGPKDQNGEVIGGRHLGVASLEYEQLVFKNWGAALFVDAGNAFDDFGEPLKIGAGIGIRWYSPVGPIRLDLATPVDAGNLGVRLHISMGPEL